MQWVSAYRRALHVQDKPEETKNRDREFNESITARGVHELLFNPVIGDPVPLLPALQAIRAATSGAFGVDVAAPRTLIWVDSAGTLYPPAVGANGGWSEPFYILRPRSTDTVWAAIECLRCPSVGAVVALMMDKPSRVDVRRLQLAAEKGGGIGLLLRPNLASAAPHIYAAATRWLVSPVPGERTIQRWRLQLLHGHGRLLGQTFLLEKHRATGQTHFVPISAPLVHHPLHAAAS